MNEPPKADFQFAGFRITQFDFEEPTPEYQVIHMDINQTGTYDENTGVFILYLAATISATKDKEKVGEMPIFRLKADAGFHFPGKNKFDEIPPYFYSNSIAILFPYLRSFVSNTTLQANARLIMLPLLNFSSYGESLKTSTKVIVKEDTKSE